MLIDKEQYQAWLHNPVTKEVGLVMRERKNRIATMLAQGSCMIDGFDEVLYGESVGRYREIDDYLNMQFEDLKGEQ